MLWIEVKTSAEEKNRNSKVFKPSVASADGFNLLNFAIDSFCFGSSSPGEFHPRALTEPRMSLSTHAALTMQPFGIEQR